MILKDYTREQIFNLIEIIKDCAREGRYTISLEDNKLENIQFIDEYNINRNKCIDILFDLEVEDFCYGLQDMKDGIELKDLYVFCPKRELYNIRGLKEEVDIYLKFDVIELQGNEYRVVFSMHKRNKPITYIFK